MDPDSQLVLLVEHAAAHAWDKIPRPPVHLCPELVPPTEGAVLVQFVQDAAAWLRKNGGDVVIDARAVRGRHAYKAEHVWLELTTCQSTLDGSAVVVRADIATPLGCDMHLVASDVCIAKLVSAGQKTYARRISVCFVGARDVFLTSTRVEVAPEHVVTEAFPFLWRAMRALLAHVAGSTPDTLEASVRELAVQFGNTPKCSEVCARILCDNILEVLRVAMGGLLGYGTIDDAIAVLDADWRVAFRARKLWKTERSGLMALQGLHGAEKTQIELVSLAYQRVVAAVMRVVHETDIHLAASAASGSVVCAMIPDACTPAQEYLMRTLGATAQTAKRYGSNKLGTRVGERYPPNIWFLLECVREFVYQSRFGTADSLQQASGELRLMRVSWESDTIGDERGEWGRFFMSVQHCAATRMPQLALLRDLLTTWVPLDARYLQAVPTAPVVQGESAVVAEEELPRLTHVRVSFAYTLDGGAPKLRITTSAGDETPAVGWDKIGLLCDMKGNVWTAYRQLVSDQEATGSMRVFLDSLALVATDEFASADVVWLMAELPQHKRVALSCADDWAMETVPFVIAPLRTRRARDMPDGDQWTAYLEGIRRATHVLRATREEELSFYAVACPRSFVPTEFNPGESPVDQWIAYFSEMPHVVYHFLDSLRKRYDMVFGLAHGVDDGGPAVLTHVHMRFQPLVIEVDSAMEGGLRAYDRALADAVWEWKRAAEAPERAVVIVPNVVLRESIQETLARTRTSCSIKSEQISDEMCQFGMLVKDYFHAGMVFARCRKGHVELSLHRTLAHFFELSYTRALLALHEAVLTGELPGGKTAVYMKMSPGYLADAELARAQLRSAVVIRPGEWKEDSLPFLADWMRRHLHRAVEKSLAVLRVSPDRIEFLPSVALVCRLRKVHFLVTAHLGNLVESVATRDETFYVPGVVTVDAKTKMCTVDLGERVATWFGTRVLANETVDGTLVRVAPYTRATGNVHLCAIGEKSVIMGTFVADSATNKFVRGKTMRVEWLTNYPKESVMRQNHRASVHQKIAYDIVYKSKLDADNAPRAMRALAAHKFHESFTGMPLYPELADHAPPNTYKRCVVQEYYENPLVHPCVTSVRCVFPLQKFVAALYATDNAFLSTIQ